MCQNIDSVQYFRKSKSVKQARIPFTTRSSHSWTSISSHLSKSFKNPEDPYSLEDSIRHSQVSVNASMPIAIGIITKSKGVISRTTGDAEIW